MTDRVRELVVILDREVREDDLDDIITAMGMIRCVAKVKLGKPVSHERYYAVEQAKRELRAKLFAVLEDK